MLLSIRFVEKLPAAAFILGGAVIGTALYVARDSVRPTPTSIVLNTAIFWAAGGVAWWLCVRRRQYPVWQSALQLTLIIALAQIVAFPITLARVAPPDLHLQWRDITETQLSTQGLLSALRFVECLVYIAIGRLLPGSGRPAARNEASPMTPDAVT